MLKYYSAPRKNPIDKKNYYHAQLQPVTPVNLSTICDLIEKRSTVSSADAKAVLDALQFEIKEALKRGDSVRLGDLGSFRLTLGSLGVEKPEDLTTSDIKTVRVRFTPSATLQKEFILGKGQKVTFQKVDNPIKDETVTEP